MPTTADNKEYRRPCKSCEEEILVAPITTREGVEKHHPFNLPAQKRFVMRPDGRYMIVDTYGSHLKHAPRHKAGGRKPKRREASEW